VLAVVSPVFSVLIEFVLEVTLVFNEVILAVFDATVVFKELIKAVLAVKLFVIVRSAALVVDN
jgi:hypothetical protein